MRLLKDTLQYGSQERVDNKEETQKTKRDGQEHVDNKTRAMVGVHPLLLRLLLRGGVTSVHRRFLCGVYRYTVRCTVDESYGRGCTHFF